jgi:hypothetical protein
MHGHVHARRDYPVRTTRIVCNPRGHIGEDCLREFDPSFVVEA